MAGLCSGASSLTTPSPSHLRKVKNNLLKYICLESHDWRSKGVLHRRVHTQSAGYGGCHAQIEQSRPCTPSSIVNTRLL
ncbi:hypothetical protein FH972_010545 [Carpinus fangiana]|uniref:Uncharacterized protein n=1 Tax=Carpinus fangiana TaxID=176857 RepID=A0A660KNL2_9ROSI|nr:hypothetical protein FH972_010545 [Carpinus fangiana]